MLKIPVVKVKWYSLLSWLCCLLTWKYFVFISYCCWNKFPPTQWLKTHKFIILEFCRLEMWHRCHWAKSEVLAGLHSSLETLGDNLFSYPFQLLECLCSLICGPFLHLQCQQHCVSLVILLYSHLFLFLNLPSPESFSYFKYPCD